MKKHKSLLTIILGVLLVTVLAACKDTDIESSAKLELDFIDIERHGSYAYAYYASPEDKTYYRLEVTSYQYNNWDTAGYPDKLKIVRGPHFTDGFGNRPYIQALILSDLDKEKDRDFDDIDIKKIKVSELKYKFEEVNYWGDEGDEGVEE